MIKTSLELYDKLCDDAGLQIKDSFYDAEFNEQLFEALQVKNKEELEKISIEQFVQEFFSALYPYSLMMSEILKFYEEAESKSNGKNIEIKFNVNDVDSKLIFDLNKFKEYYENLNDTIISYTSKINNNDLQEIWKLFCENSYNNKKKISHVSLMCIEDRVEWPKEIIFDNYDKLNDEELYLIVKQLMNILNDLLNYAKSESNSFADLFQLYEIKATDNTIKTNSIELTTRQILNAIRNRVLSSLYNEINESIINKNIDNLKNDLKRIFKIDQSNNREEYINKFEEFLSLPIWKARHEIYSVWVSAKIKEATDYLNPQINAIDGKLEYSFKTYKLISYDTLPVKIDLYSELKLPYNKNISSKRKEYVQPDYTLVQKRNIPLNEDAILVIECKQYKRSNKKNFTEVIIDYANAHPNAHIFLVNYGNITQSVIQAIHKHNIQESRYTLINHFEPTNSKSLNLFRDEIRNQLVTYYLEPKTISIELSWNNKFRDLDLELEFEVDQTKHYVNYSCKEYPTIENFTNEMNIKLNKDVIKNDTNHDLNDKEIIEIKNFEPNQYNIRVINYSKETNFNESDAVVVIRDNNRIYKKLEISKDDIIDDSVWNVFKFKSIEDLL